MSVNMMVGMVYIASDRTVEVHRLFLPRDAL